MIEAALHKILSSNPTLGALIHGRVHPDTDPQKSPRPKITYTRISRQNLLSNDGPGNAPTARFRVDCWADLFDGAADLANAADGVLDGYRGTVAITGKPSIVIDSIHVRNVYSNPVPIPSGSGQERPLQRYSLEVVIHYKT